jgi:hypothetical protein
LCQLETTLGLIHSEAVADVFQPHSHAPHRLGIRKRRPDSADPNVGCQSPWT